METTINLTPLTRTQGEIVYRGLKVNCQKAEERWNK